MCVIVHAYVYARVCASLCDGVHVCARTGVQQREMCASVHVCVHGGVHDCVRMQFVGATASVRHTCVAGSVWRSRVARQPAASSLSASLSCLEWQQQASGEAK